MIDKIDFDTYIQDLVKLGGDRRLTLFHKACVLSEVLNIIIQQDQELDDVFIEVLKGRTIAEGIGVQLDVEGRLVGQDRILLNRSIIPYFTPDNQDLRMDNSRLFVTGAPTSGSIPADDVSFRELIAAKVFKNHIQGATIADIIVFAKILYGINISVVKLGDLNIKIKVPAGTPTYIRDNLKFNQSTKQVDEEYFIPMPSGTTVTLVEDF